MIASRNLKKIEFTAFYNCTALKVIYLPEGFRHIDEIAFSGCKLLQKIRLPSSISYLKQGCFSGSGLTEIILPATIKIIEDNLFSYCS